MTGIYVLLAICAVLSLASLVTCVLMLKKRDGGEKGVTIEEYRDENARLKNDIDMDIKMGNSMLAGAINAQNDNVKAMGERMDRFMYNTQKGLEDVKHCQLAPRKRAKHKGNERGQRKATGQNARNRRRKIECDA